MRDRSKRGKGDFLENVVAALHEMPDARIETRVRVPVLDDPGASREIDILISGMGLGYELRRAIECKSWSKRVGVEAIDEFIGKLKDIGIPASLCAFVSANGFTKPAIRRGAKEGIRLLTIGGLTKGGLSSVIEAAFQYIVYLVPIVEGVQQLNDRSGETSVIRSLRYQDPKTGRSHWVLDNLWKKWVTGDLPRSLGLHHARFEIPQEPSLFGEEEAPQPRVVYFEVRVVAAVTRVRGTATEHSLRNVQTRRIEKRRISTRFDSGPAEVRLLESESEVDSYLRGENAHTKLVLSSIPLPRIIYFQTYWPPTIEALRRSKEQYDRGQKPTFETVEGADFTKAWSFLLDESVIGGIPDDLAFEMYPSIR